MRGVVFYICPHLRCYRYVACAELVFRKPEGAFFNLAGLQTLSAVKTLIEV